MLGGLAGYLLVVPVHDLLPYFLVVASSSFIYVALADLIPQLQTRLGARQTAAQIIWLLAGIALVGLVSSLARAAVGDSGGTEDAQLITTRICEGDVGDHAGTMSKVGVLNGLFCLTSHVADLGL